MALWTPQIQVTPHLHQQCRILDVRVDAALTAPSSDRYKEHEDGFLRLQLIRYESVELTEQLMRERQNRQAEEDEDMTEEQVMEQESPGMPPSEVQVELRGVLLEEQRVEEPTISTEEAILYNL